MGDILRKKFLISTISIILAFVVSGCSKKNLEKLPNVVSSFENADVEISQNDDNYKCNFSRFADGSMKAVFRNPENINGLTIEIKDGKYKTSMGELSGEFTGNPLCENAAILQIIKIFDSLNNISEDDNKIMIDKIDNISIESKNEEYNYKINLDSDGKIIHICIPKINLKANFKY